MYLCTIAVYALGTYALPIKGLLKLFLCMLLGDMPQGFIPASSPSARLWATHHFKTGPLGLGWYETESYVPASSFGNGRAGYCFKTGSQGVGFYKER